MKNIISDCSQLSRCTGRFSLLSSSKPTSSISNENSIDIPMNRDEPMADDDEESTGSIQLNSDR
ncbi:unnamed protein product, partial [Rotaria socialis]